MNRSRRFILLLSLVGLVLATAATPAQARKRQVPFGFFGAVLSPELSNPNLTSDAALDQQTALMARSGVETARITLLWEEVEPARNFYNFAALDRQVAAAARHGVSLLVNATASPRWASERPNSVEYWRSGPADPGTYAEFMRQLVLRYGPRGNFWALNPSVPRVPVRQWQIWNEESAPFFWARKPWAPSYTRLLRAAYRVIHGADRGATVVAGSFVGVGNYSQWAATRDLYRAGAKRGFDVIAIHPFTNATSVNRTVAQVLETVRRVRAEMRRRGDGRKPIILTEVTWPAARGRVPNNPVQWIATSAQGQAQRLTSTYRSLAGQRRQLGVTQAYWFTWATPYDALGPLSIVTFRFSGLTRLQNGVFTPMPILRTYASVAAGYEGCRKGSNAVRCG
jgi:hypothetical protein